MDTYEFGAKASFNGAVRGYFNLAAFYNDFRNQQIQASAVPKPGTGLPGANMLVNAGKSRIQGIEADLSISPFEGFRIDAGYAYLDTRLNSIVLPALPPTSPYAELRSTVPTGGGLTLAPKHKATITGSYTLPMSKDVGEVTLGVTFSHTSRQLLSQTNLTAFLEPLSLLNLHLSWNDVGGAPVDLAAFATNVTNKRYYTFINGSFATVGYESANIGEPRVVGVRMKVRFGN